MKKIYIVRERLEWHNCDADECTTAYDTEIAAKKGLIKKYEDTMRWLQNNEYEFIDSMTEYRVDSGSIVTDREDYYHCWIEEIEYYF